MGDQQRAIRILQIERGCSPPLLTEEVIHLHRQRFKVRDMS